MHKNTTHLVYSVTKINQVDRPHGMLGFIYCLVHSVRDTMGGKTVWDVGPPFFPPSPSCIHVGFLNYVTDRNG